MTGADTATNTLKTGAPLSPHSSSKPTSPSQALTPSPSEPTPSSPNDNQPTSPHTTPTNTHPTPQASPPTPHQAPRSKRSHRAVQKILRNDEIGFFNPKTWEFWRALIVSFCLFSIVGHWLEIPYCSFMDHFFGIVDDNYAVWFDPWYHPYWVYGFGAVAMTLLLEPFKERIIIKRKTLWGALLETFVLMVFISMVLELVIGLIVNQPDPLTGEYPYWDNSQLPFNILGQAWLVNDIVIGLMAMIYLWLFYPLICLGFAQLRPKVANVVFALMLVIFAICCGLSYGELITSGILGS